MDTTAKSTIFCPNTCFKEIEAIVDTVEDAESGVSVSIIKGEIVKARRYEVNSVPREKPTYHYEVKWEIRGEPEQRADIEEDQLQYFTKNFRTKLGGQWASFFREDCDESLHAKPRCLQH